MTQQLISIIVPVYNEAPNIPVLHKEIVKHVSGLPYDFEFVFVDDGSRDGSAQAVQRLVKKKRRIRLIELSRNFGKEAAVSAGLHAAKGDAAIILDADLQHPPSLIRKFIQKWRKGAEVVVGVKHYGKGTDWFQRFTSDWFYKVLSPVSESEVIPHAADYRLLDRRVINAFRGLKEHNRITRGLIDWLGFRRDYVQFDVAPRRHGERSYTFRKRLVLAMHSFTAYSLMPLKLAGYIGNSILLLSAPAGLFLVIETYILRDPLNWNITGTAMLALLTLFLVGMVLTCIGLVALYIANIHAEVTDRPLYIIRDQIEAGQQRQLQAGQPLLDLPAEIASQEPEKEILA
jgi:glycosyltransferase involved in cell wall biosynthesis